MLHRLPEILCDCMVHKRRRYYVDDSPHTIVEGIPTHRSDDLKAWLSVMYGCNNFCTYCVVPYVRGRERSRSADAVLAEAKALVKQGYKEITLLGQNVNSYKGEMSFAELLRKTASFGGEYVVRFMTSHPKDASDELIRVIAENKNVGKHFHLPMQSGSTDVLRRMNRKYTAEHYLALAQAIRARVPDISLTTDIIVGFPGETEKDFEQTLTMLRTVEFDSVYSFIYSPRVGTPAADMPDAIPDHIAKERFARLVALQQDISHKRDDALIGKDLRVLVDTHYDGKSGFVCTRTSGNKVIRLRHTDDTLYGTFVTVTVEPHRQGESGLYAHYAT